MYFLLYGIQLFGTSFFTATHLFAFTKVIVDRNIRIACEIHHRDRVGFQGLYILHIADILLYVHGVACK